MQEISWEFIFNGALPLIYIIERHLALRSTLAKGLSAFYCLILFTLWDKSPLHPQFADSLRGFTNLPVTELQKWESLLALHDTTLSLSGESLFSSASGTISNTNNSDPDFSESHSSFWVLVYFQLFCHSMFGEHIEWGTVFLFLIDIVLSFRS